LITALDLSARRGVQSVTRDLAVGLRDAGHHPTLYARVAGPAAEDLRRAGFDVETTVDALSGAYDVIHVQQIVTCSPVLARFPEIPAVFVCHDNAGWFDEASPLPNVRRYAAVSGALAERVMFDARVARDKVDLILNTVDLRRFEPGPTPAPTPKKALAFAKNEEHVETIRAACLQRGIAVDFIGQAASVEIADAGTALPNYDLVFASALSALEAMACLRPTIVCDGRGMAGMVDMPRYEKWRPENFGLGVFNAPLSVERTLAEIDRYDAAEAARVGERFRQEAGLESWIERYVDLYRAAIATPAPSKDEWDAKWAKHLERWTPRPSDEWAWTHDRQALVNELRRVRTGLEPLPRENRLTFGQEGAAARFVDPVGFEQQQSGAVWTTARLATLRFRPGAMPTGLGLALEYAVSLPDAAFGLEIAALVNGVEVARWTETGFTGWAERKRDLMLARDVCYPAMTWLAFRFTQIAGGPPTQATAFSLRAMTFRDDPAADRA
jgi:hypothetical protein